MLWGRGVWVGWGQCSVPNIKFNVAKLTSAFVPLVGSSVVESQIRPCLLELNSDSDLDVRFFAGAFGPCSSLLPPRRLLTHTRADFEGDALPPQLHSQLRPTRSHLA